MVNRRFGLIAAALILASTAGAQDHQSTLDMDAVLKAGQQLYNPASVALKYRKELSLTDSQTKTLDSLSSVESHFDIMSLARPSAEERAMSSMLMNLSVPIDEDLVKRGIQARVERETKNEVDRAKADRRVASVLTPIQRIAFMSLRMRSFADMMSSQPSKTSH